MSIIVEDGTKVVGAESYISVAEADAYHSKRGNTAWDLLDTTDQKEPALRKATDYLEQAFFSLWKGIRVEDGQPLSWPRKCAYIDDYTLIDDNIVPEAVKRACAELALKASAAELAPDMTQGVVSETVGPISVTYDTGSPQRKRYRAIENMLAPYLKAGGGAMVRIDR